MKGAPITPRALVALVIAPSAMVKKTVVEAVPRRLLASTWTENVPVRVGIPEIKPVGPSQPTPGGRPDAVNQVGLLSAASW